MCNYFQFRLVLFFYDYPPHPSRLLLPVLAPNVTTFSVRFLERRAEEKSAHDVRVFSYVTRTCLVHDVTDTDRHTQNGSAHNRVSRLRLSVYSLLLFVYLFI